MKGLIGRKISMHQLFMEDGDLLPVTIIEVLPNVVTQVKTKTVDKYIALQLAYGYKKDKSLTKPLRLHLKKAKTENKAILIEFRDMTGYKLGDNVDLSIFNPGNYIDIRALTKGKGTSGVIKRHHFHRGPMTHGSKHHRAPGSVGISRPDKIWKGQPLPGRKGHVYRTEQNLEIVHIDLQKNLLFIRGSCPGANNSYCKITFALKKQKNASQRKLFKVIKENQSKDEKVISNSKKIDVKKKLDNK